MCGFSIISRPQFITFSWTISTNSMLGPKNKIKSHFIILCQIKSTVVSSS